MHTTCGILSSISIRKLWRLGSVQTRWELKRSPRPIAMKRGGVEKGRKGGQGKGRKEKGKKGDKRGES